MTFDLARDHALIAAGTHFRCYSHTTAIPIEQRSPDPEYCLECYEIIKQARKYKMPKVENVE